MLVVRPAVLLPAVFVTACGGGTTPAGPSAVRLDTPGSVSIAVSGSVRDAQQNDGIADVQVEVTSGPDTSKATRTDGSGNYSLAGLRPGAFTVRFNRSDFEVVERTVSASQDTRVDVLLRRGPTCMALPPPTNFRATVAGTRVTFNWNAVAGTTEYVIGVGTAPNGSNVLSFNTTQTSYQWRAAPPGTLFARVEARSGCHHVNPSNEITFAVGTSSSS